MICGARSRQGTVCERERGHVGCHEAYVDGDGRRWWGEMRLTKAQKRHMLRMLRAESDASMWVSPWRSEWRTFDRLEALGLCKVTKREGGPYSRSYWDARLTDDGRRLANGLKREAERSTA
jgi:hypothetical protein